MCERVLDYVPVPESSITCGLEEALSTIKTVPDFGPCVFGEKATLILQLAPAATLLRQVEVMANWPATLIDAMLSAVLPGIRQRDVLWRAGGAGGLLIEVGVAWWVRS